MMILEDSGLLFGATLYMYVCRPMYICISPFLLHAVTDVTN